MEGGIKWGATPTRPLGFAFGRLQLNEENVNSRFMLTHFILAWVYVSCGMLQLNAVDDNVFNGFDDMDCVW